jgi:hypothetical protein
MSVEILVKNEYTKIEIAKANEHPGYKAGRTAGGWIHDLCALKKVITLCPLCQHKFNPGRLQYIRDKDMPIVQATCDGCKTFDTRCAAYFFEETFKTVRSTASDRRAERTAARKRQLALQ